MLLKQIMTNTLLWLVFLSVSAVPAMAGVEQIVADFKPLPAYIVMDMQGEYIIDKDASHGVRSGDIFAALTAGEKIVHPVTGEILGSLDQVRAQLRVSKVKNGYSYAVPLPGSNKLKPGEVIARFQGVAARFWDYSGEGENLYTELKAGLPALEWNDYTATQAEKPERLQAVDGLDGLIFVLTGKGLEVRDAAFQPVRFYSRDDLARQGVGLAEKQSVVAAPVALPVISQSGAGIATSTTPATVSSSGIALTTQNEPAQGVWSGPDMPGEIVAVEAVDIDGDGQVETVTAFPHKILLGSLTGGRYHGRGFIDMPERIRIVGVDAADLDKNGKPEIYISAVEMDLSIEQEVIASMVAEEKNGSWQIIADDIPYLLARFDLAGEGQLIAAQRIAEEQRTYGGKVFRLLRKGNKFKKGEEIDFGTHKLTVHGFTTFDNSGKTLVALFDINERLEVHTLAGEQLWASGEIMGGNQAFIERNDPGSRSDTLRYYLKARLVNRDDGTVLVPKNEGSSRFSSHHKYNKSRLIAMQWDGYAMKEVGATEPQSGYMAGFQVADVDNDGRDEIIMGIVYSQGGGLLSKIRARSALVVNELQ